MPDLESLLEYNEIVRKLFANEEEGFQFYNKYALEKVFSVRRSYCEWNNGNIEMTLRKCVCSREGFREEKHLKRQIKKRKPRNITRVGCPAKLVIARAENTGQWYVKGFIDEHNHPMSPADLTCMLRSHRRISDEQKADILEMQISGVRTKGGKGGKGTKTGKGTKRGKQTKATGSEAKTARKNTQPKRKKPQDTPLDVKIAFSQETIAERIQGTSKRARQPGRLQTSPFKTY